MWAPDGARLFYVSDVFGVPAALVSQELADKSKPALFSKDKNGKPFHADTVRRARLSRDGNAIVYECGGDLWVTATKEGSTPKKLAVEVYADDKTNPDSTTTFTNRATEFAVSPDEKHLAVVVHGEVFRSPRWPMALSVLVGNGSQLVAMTGITLGSSPSPSPSLSRPQPKLIVFPFRNQCSPWRASSVRRTAEV